MTLDQAVGKTISDFCRCGFINASDNHCAHFVSHFLEFDFDMTCKKLTNIGTTGANVRVQEIFKRCPTVGWLTDWSGSERVMVFVTEKTNVNLSTKVMANVPKKHIGILEDGFVYHYGNTQDKVKKQTIADFKATFNATYGGDLGYYYGTISNRPVPLRMPEIKYEIRDKDIFATVDGGAEFYVAREYHNQARNWHGLFQPSGKLSGNIYDPSSYVEKYDQWAYLLFAIGQSESANRFNRVNTYDRVAFTFGFFQLAAHTPSDNLILFLRQAIEIDDFKRFFPDLKIENGKLTQITSPSNIDLEKVEFNSSVDEDQLQNLMKYLNPNRSTVDRTEIIHAIKLVELSRISADFRRLQVKTAVQITSKKFRERYHPWYDLSGKSDAICLTIADIHHQGRAKKATVKSALNSANPLNALLDVGKTSQPERCKSLREIVNTLMNDGKLGKHKYESAHGLFVPI